MYEHGSEIVRVDFHLHTRKDKEFKYSGEENSFVNDYAETLAEKNIRIGVITNHNKFDYGEFKALRSAAKKNGVLLLPGVELSVKEGANGLHTLIIFDPDAWLRNGVDDINKFLDNVFPGIPNRENANTRCRCDLSGTIAALDEYEKDYFIVFAHVDQSNGLFEECGGGLLESLAKDARLQKRVLGLQKVRNYERLSKLPKYWRTQVARVEGSDPKSTSSIGKDGSQCYVKIGDSSYSALKYALADYSGRVFANLPVTKHGYIKGISFQGGKLDGQFIGLSDKLNTMIGIRGSGKSSILEALRYALSIEPSQDATYKNDLIKHILGSGGKVILHIVDQHGSNYRVERILGESVSVIDSQDKTLAIPVHAILKNPLYFGQKDLAMSKPGFEMDLLNKLVGANIPSAESQLNDVLVALTDNLRQYMGIREIPEKIASLEEKARECTHKLRIFAEKGITERLEKQTMCNADKTKLANLHRALSEMIDRFDACIAFCDTAGFYMGDYTSKYNTDLFDGITELIGRIDAHIAEISRHLLEIGNEKVAFEALQKALDTAIDALKEEFANIKREIAEDTIDLDGFEKYQKEQMQIEHDIAHLKRTLGSKEAFLSSISSGFRRRNELLLQTFRAYETEIERINAGQSELRISIQFKGNKTVFLEQLRSSFRGTHVNEAKYQQLTETFSDMAAIVEDYFLNDGKKLRGLVSDREYVLISEKIDANYADYLAEKCPDLVQIMYHGKELSKHSMGQRASALMLFILSQDDNDVVIIDQPEDDLDNQVVYTEFIKTLKKKKNDSQFIFATHNANIPVLGDAERVVSAQYSDSRIDLTMGSIDTPSTHKQIVDIMEGGIEAFKRRNAIYTLWQ